jgi:hypothetical protein
MDEGRLDAADRDGPLDEETRAELDETAPSMWRDSRWTQLTGATDQARVTEAWQLGYDAGRKDADHNHRGRFLPDELPLAAQVALAYGPVPPGGGILHGRTLIERANDAELDEIRAVVDLMRRTLRAEYMRRLGPAGKDTTS